MSKYLDYPFDAHEILKKKRSIKRELLQQKRDFIKTKIAILGGSTTSEIKEILELFLLDDGIMPLFYESGFNKFYEEVLFENEKLEEFKPDIIFIHTTNINIVNYPDLQDSKNHPKHLLNEEIVRFKSIWERIQKTFKCSIIQNNFELPHFRSLGNLDFADLRGRANFIMQLNCEFAKFAQNNKNFYINDINYLSSWFGLERWHDKTFWHLYKYALSYEAVPLLSYNVGNIIKSIYGKSKKCLVLDLDNILWGGLIGENGVSGIELGNETAIAESYVEFQKYVKNLKNRGIALAVCSKNDLKNAKEGFSHPDTILKFSDFVAFKANWNNKYENILEIAKEINIGLESIVFVDDCAVEREFVKSQIPSIKVPVIGNDVVKYIDIIDKSGYFEPVVLTNEDSNRNQFLKENIERYKTKSKFKSYNDFLASLNMTAEISRFKPIYFDRITQLINKTNQFNLTTKRYNYSEIEKISKDLDYIPLYGKLSDKFGSYGLISIIIGNIVDGRQLHIDLWILSCRVFKRCMEFAMFDALVNECKKKKIDEIIGYYFKTSKNSIVEDFYQTIGFDIIEKNKNNNSSWKFIIPNNYSNKNKFIRIGNG